MHLVEPIEPDEPSTMRDWGYEAQMAAERHIDACDEAEERMNELAEQGSTVFPGTPAVAPYDGCGICQVREAIAAAWPFPIAMVAEYVAAKNPELAEEILTAYGVQRCSACGGVLGQHVGACQVVEESQVIFPARVEPPDCDGVN